MHVSPWLANIVSSCVDVEIQLGPRTTRPRTHPKDKPSVTLGLTGLLRKLLGGVEKSVLVPSAGGRVEPCGKGKQGPGPSNDNHGVPMTRNPFFYICQCGDGDERKDTVQYRTRTRTRQPVMLNGGNLCHRFPTPPSPSFPTPDTTVGRYDRPLSWTKTQYFSVEESGPLQ
jgi:hypothetical protein